MRREHLSLEVSNVGWLSGEGDPRQPTLTVEASDAVADLRDRLLAEDGADIAAGDVDVTFRFRDGDRSDRDGVVAITDRLTGEFLLELNVPAPDVMEFVAAARRYAERAEAGTRYRARVVADGEDVVDIEKRTLLVYSSEGELLRERSLIPSGVEI